MGRLLLVRSLLIVCLLYILTIFVKLRNIGL